MPLAPKARSAAGAQLQMGDGASPEVFTKLAQLMAFKYNGNKQASEETTNQDSSADTNSRIYKELIGTIVDGGTIDGSVNFVPGDSTHRALLAAADGKQHNFKILGPNDTAVSPVAPLFTIACPGLLLDLPDLDLDLKKAMTLSFKITVIGPPVFTYST